MEAGSGIYPVLQITMKTYTDYGRHWRFYRSKQPHIVLQSNGDRETFGGDEMIVKWEKNGTITTSRRRPTWRVEHGEAGQHTVLDCWSATGAITSKIKHAIKHKTSPARLAQLLQPLLVFCFSLQQGLDGTPSLAGR